MSGWELPYEDVPEDPVPLHVEGFFVDAVSIRAAVMDSPLGVLPLVIFDFSSSTSHAPMAPIIYAGSPAGLRSLRKVLHDSITGAIRAAERTH